MPFYSLIKTFVFLSLSLPQFEVRRTVLQVYSGDPLIRSFIFLGTGLHIYLPFSSLTIFPGARARHRCLPRFFTQSRRLCFGGKRGLDLAKGKGSAQRKSLLPHIISLKLIHWNRLRCLMSSFKRLPCWLKTKVKADLMKEVILLRMCTNLLLFLTLRPVLFRRRCILFQIMLGGVYNLRSHWMWESFSNRTSDTCRLPSQPFPLRQLQLKGKLANLKEAPHQVSHHNPVRLRCLSR